MAEITEYEVGDTAIDGLKTITMKQVSDERGTVREFYRESAFVAAGLPSLGPWLQVNITETHHGGLRGMHAESMHKLVAVAAGEVFGAWVDLRAESDSFGTVVTTTLGPGSQVLVPPGVGNGFQVTSPGVAQYVYCFDREWVPGMAGVACSPLDPALGIDWPVPIRDGDLTQVSVKDRDAPLLSHLQGADR